MTHLDVAIAGIGFRITAQAESWLAALRLRYAEFASEADSPWHVELLPNDASAEAVPWITHDEQQTRFQVDGYGGSIDLAARQAQVRTASPETAVVAVERVLTFICMQALPRERQALLLHATGAIVQGQGLALCGASDAGKTTAARLAAGYATVLSDEAIVVSAAGPQPLLLSTPFWGASTPLDMICRANQQTPLAALLLLEQGPRLELAPLAGAEALLALLLTERVAAERVASATAWLAVAEQLVARVPVYRLRFTPTPELWPFLAESLLG